jgi:serine/threonine-protein kinase RsbT
LGEDSARSGDGDDALLELIPVVRRVIAARVRDPHLAEDLVQETLARMTAVRARLDPESLVPYAIVTARNLIAAHVERSERERRKAHLVADSTPPDSPEESTLAEERRAIVAQALDRLQARDRDLLVAHEVHGTDTATLAAGWDSTPGAIAAQLSRSRARLRVEVLLTEAGQEPPTDRCRPVLLALSAGERRRQRQLDTAGHLLACDFCAALAPRLLDGRPGGRDDELRVPISRDADVVTARLKGREVAARVGFSRTDATLIATVISEVARNIVQFAERGEIVVCPVERGDRTGVLVVARDAGPGIPDVTKALQDGYTTYGGGLGLGLPGSRRLMDEFDLVSETGRGTTITMTRWLRGDPRPPAGRIRP